MVSSARAYGPWDLRQEKFRRNVTSEDELRKAIRSLASTHAAARMTTGGLIVICAPIVLTAPVTIPETTPGLTITSAAKFPIRSRGVISTAFQVQAELVTIRDLFVYLTTNPATGFAQDYFTTFVTALAPVTSGRSSTRLSVLDNDVFCDRIYVDSAAGLASDTHVRGNRQSEANAAHSAAIVIDSPDCRVVDNNCAAGGTDTITVAANGSRCSLRGNHIGGGTITTNASAGLNTIVGNVNCGVITAAGSDAVGNNS
jgi:hypothetical protein